ncbi:2TM domain-containing protein [Seonamhaeicola aphaedonensis]|uniref:2TM domain-containing protein n=1 Tax=Seonamhaeicola aphaedonensis TaxID=1461338 RepID=A0A3D9HDU1_9FLAO|nr:2TM domain-containing protein [Seonamhaeicola aphaedonensis]RED47421.1 2TM domain-containing protein [Seonamhaeicola aphaedonensis]
MRRLEQNYNQEHFRREDAYLRAQKRLKELKGFYWHAFWYLAVNIFIVIMIGRGSNWNIWHFGTLATPLFWGIGLGFHALGVFGKNLFFSKSWEERKINEFMEKEQENSSEFQ